MAGEGPTNPPIETIQISWNNAEQTEIYINSGKAFYLYIYEDNIQIDTIEMGSQNYTIYQYTPSNSSSHEIIVRDNASYSSNTLYKIATSGPMTSKQVTLTDYFYTETEVDGFLAGKVDKVTGKGLSTNDYTTAEKTKLSGIETGATKTTIDSSLSGSSTNPVQNKVINTALSNKVDKENGKGLFSGSYSDLTNKPTNVSSFVNDAGYLTDVDISDLGGVVTVEQQASAETGYTATYVVKQGGSQVGTKINIPKDFLVRSASVGTSSANNSPQAGFSKGDKYLDFVINTKTNSETAEHLYVNVKDLFNEYQADETTLTLNSLTSTFSIKSGVIPQPSSTATDIKVNGTQSAGSASTYAKADHVHPTDTSRASSTHEHGSITNDGKIGTVSGKPIITGTNGALGAGSFGTSAGTFAEGNHTHSEYLSNADVSNKLEASDLDDILGLSYDDTTGVLSLVINTNNSGS